MAQRTDWKKLGCKEYLCVLCKRNKGMLYLFPDKTLRYVCFCGNNISTSHIEKEYDFDKNVFVPKKSKPSPLTGDTHEHKKQV